jgi:glycosyltransferase involved in cell wall biosynthesis
MSNSSDTRPHLALMGIRGLPAAHGGFEAFAERLAPFLAAQGWQVTVYCQEDGAGAITESMWGQVHRVHIPSGDDTPVASMRFDWACITHAKKVRPDVTLILGYNTAAFAARLRLAGLRTVINMDGIEWSRAKWGPMARAWLYLNERMGCWLGNHLVADHPVIAAHLASRVSRRKITTIPYGSVEVLEANASLLEPLKLAPRQFVTLIARPEPENSVLEVVQAFSARKRGVKLVVLGKYAPEESPFHAEVLKAASDEVVFPGAIYDSAVVEALRLNCLFYIHGHQVGGTNPSLLEAMGAGNAVLAHDNPFNRWVVGKGAVFFRNRGTCAAAIEQMLSEKFDLAAMREASRQRARHVFGWAPVLNAYSNLLHSVARASQISEASRQANSIWTQHST